MTITRRHLLQGSAVTAGAAALGLGFETTASAKAPLAAAQAASFYRTKAGGFEVTVLNDGAAELPSAAFFGKEPGQVEGLLTKAGRSPSAVSLAINAFAINTGDKLFMIDTGAGANFADKAGYLPGNLKAAGYAPDQVDAIMLTHLHGDHAGGLVSADGTPAYKNATLLANEKELAFWSDEGNLTRVPEFVRPTFKLLGLVKAAYKGKIQQFKDGETLAPGITVVETAGHTVGHSSIRVGTGNDAILIWGDIVHSSTIHFARPEFGFLADSDPSQAAQTRKKILDQAASDNLSVAGAHLDFPAFGKVAREATGFSYNPGFWTPKL